MMNDIHSIKQFLFEKYKGFSDKRIKKIESGDTFIVDDRTKSDEGSNGALYPNFCMIFLTIRDSEKLVLQLSGNVPSSHGLSKFIEQNKAIISTGVRNLEIKILKSNYHILDELARLIEDIVAPGNRYSDRSYKYVCPQTAKSIRRLRTNLDQIWD